MQSAATVARQSSRQIGDPRLCSHVTRFAVTVDTEEEWNWSSGWPSGPPSVENIRLLPQFQELCSRHGASVTYFTNHAVVDCDWAAGIVQSLATEPGVEIGMHIHPWNTPPVTDKRPSTARESFLANHDRDVVRAKLHTVVERFRDRGLRPVSFRGGRYSCGPVVQEFLAEHGFIADASVVPYTAWPDDGAPDYRHRDLQPQRLLCQGKPLWEIPLTMGFSRQPFGLWQKILTSIDHSPLRRLRLIGIADRLNLVRRAWLNFEDPLGRHMLPFLRQLRRLRPQHICFTLHSSSLQVGGNGCYTITPADQKRLFAQVDQVLSLLSDWPEFQGATISQIAQSLEQQHESSRN